MSKGNPQDDDDDGICGCFGFGKSKKKPVVHQKGGNEGSTGSLHLQGLTTKEQQQVDKAVQEEVQRRKRWKMALKATSKGLKATASPKGTPSMEDVLGGLPADGSNKSAERKDGSNKSLERKEANHSASMSSSEGEKDGRLDEKRQQWIKKMQQRPSAKKPRHKKLKAAASEEQPQSLTIEASQAQEMAGHDLMNMLQKVLTASKQAEEEAAKKDANKLPSEMHPEELIRWRREHPVEWQALVNENTVASFGLSKPTSQDGERAKKILAKIQKHHGKPRRKRIAFDEKLMTATIPAGEDFQAGENPEMHSGKVSYQPDVLKKQ